MLLGARRAPSVLNIADLVVYRGQPVENDIFTHPTPELPEETDLLDLCLPYILVK